MHGAWQVTSGAASDFVAATRIAEGMVTQAGLSELGTMSIVARRPEVVSEATKNEVDKVIRAILQERYEYAMAMLKEHAIEHKRLTDALVKYETLSFEEIAQVVKGYSISREQVPQRQHVVKVHN